MLKSTVVAIVFFGSLNSHYSRAFIYIYIYMCVYIMGTEEDII